MRFEGAVNSPHTKMEPLKEVFAALPGFFVGMILGVAYAVFDYRKYLRRWLDRQKLRDQMWRRIETDFKKTNGHSNN